MGWIIPGEGFGVDLEVNCVTELKLVLATMAYLQINILFEAILSIRRW